MLTKGARRWKDGEDLRTTSLSPHRAANVALGSLAHAGRYVRIS
jgi:hypothetical protein